MDMTRRENYAMVNPAIVPVSTPLAKPCAVPYEATLNDSVRDGPVDSQTDASGRVSPLYVLAALGAGCLLTLMVHLNAESGRFGGALFSSWLAHGTGTLAAVLFLMFAPAQRAAGILKKSGAPWWAYLGGASGAVTVMLTSVSVNTPLGLAGTLALGLGGQVVFSLAADLFGLFGLPRRAVTGRDLLAVLLIAGGSLLIILYGMDA